MKLSHSSINYLGKRLPGWGQSSSPQLDLSLKRERTVWRSLRIFLVFVFISTLSCHCSLNSTISLYMSRTDINRMLVILEFFGLLYYWSCTVGILTKGRIGFLMCFKDKEILSRRNKKTGEKRHIQVCQQIPGWVLSNFYSFLSTWYRGKFGCDPIFVNLELSLKTETMFGGDYIKSL